MKLSAKLSEAIGDGMGHGGVCKCLECGYSQPHRTGEPCEKLECPKCGSKMVREGQGERPGRGMGIGRI
jgi:hypothetical protein